MYLGKLELRQIQLLHDIVAQDIRSCEKPAAPRTLLVGDRSRLEIKLRVEDMSIGNESRPREKGLPDVGMVEDRARELELGRLLDNALPRIDVSEGQRAFR